MNIKRTWVWAGAAALAALALLAWAFAPRPVEVEVAHVALGHFESSVEEDGKTRLRDRYVVSAPLAGVLTRVALREGDVVEAGAVVATLLPVLPPLHDERTLRELRAAVATARAEADRAQVQVGAAEVALARARNELARSEELARGGFVSPNKLDGDRLAAQAAQKNLEAAVEARRVAALAVQQALATLAAVQRGAGGGAFALRAPVSGRVLRVAQTSETPLAAGAPLLEIGDTRRLEVVAELLTTEALQAAPGSAVVIDRWGGARPLAGRVRAVEPGGFTKVSALGVEEQRVRVLIDLQSPLEQWQALGDGYRVNVRIVTRAVDDALLVPAAALFPLPADVRTDAGDAGAVAKADNGEAGAAVGVNAGEAGAVGVFVVQGGKAALRAVEVAARNSQDAWIRRGLQAGDVVIVYPPPDVRDGARVNTRAR